MNAEQLAEIIGCKLQRAELWIAPLNDAMEAYAIDRPLRTSAFIAQVGHESGRLAYVRELWNPNQCPWQARYEGRLDLGNTEPGDGFKYRGRGLIQITGRANYHDYGAAVGIDAVEHPELLEKPLDAARSAGWFWFTRKLNALADANDFRGITRRINGGFNGYEERLVLFNRAKAVLQ